MFTVLFSLTLFCLALLPTLMVYWNLPQFHRAATENEVADIESDLTHQTGVSVLIPARNEALGIAEAVRSVLACSAIPVEVIVMDDHSTDRTAEIVEELSKSNSRLRLARSQSLPSDWNGKQHACWQLAQMAQFDRLLFMDADVRLEPQAVSRLVWEQDRSGCSLLSGFPQQITLTVAEQLMIPMMYFVLLGYLPLARMRAGRQVEFGAGCGQLFLARRTDYLEAGGHRAIRSSRHDGLQLPRSFRRAGFLTDLVDASDLARVRMYHDWTSVLQGLQKNATEGIANAKLIVPFSLLLLGASLLPILFLAHGIYHHWPRVSIAVLGMATLLSFAPRTMIAARFESGWIGTLLHPFSVAIFVAVQWLAFLGQRLGWKRIAWRGRLQ